MEALRFRVRVRDRNVYLWAFLLVSLIGVGDKFLQGLLHDRHFDTKDVVVHALAGLLALAFADPGIRGRFARVCMLQAVIFRAPPWQKRMVFRDAMGDPAKAAALIKHTLQGSPPPGPVEELSLRLSGITGEAGRQENLFRDVRRRENLKEALGQLRARLRGQPPIYHVQEVEPWSRVPERRQALVPYVP